MPRSWLRGPGPGPRTLVGQPEVDRMMEQPGHWIAVEPTAPKPLKRQTAELNAHTASIGQVRHEVQQMAQEPVGKPRLPDVHPGTPRSARIEFVARIIRRTDKACLVELPDNPRGGVWLPLKHVIRGVTPTEPNH